MSIEISEASLRWKTNNRKGVYFLSVVTIWGADVISIDDVIRRQKLMGNDVITENHPPTS
jgi:hypothetical protein